MRNKIIHGDIREIAKTLEPQSVNCIVTSPPYWGLRDYGTATWTGGDSTCDHKIYKGGNGEASNKQVSNRGSQEYHDLIKCRHCGAIRTDSQIGHEPTPEAYVTVMVDLFRDLRRALRDDGTVWLNLGDSYAGNNTANGEGETRNLKTERFHGGKAHLEQRRTIGKTGLPSKNLIGIPWRVALALQADGWYLRSDIIWSKPNPMPESVTDRPTKAHEYIFLLSKSASYYYDGEAIKEPYQDSSLQRINQPNFDNQTGGPKDYRNGVNPNRSMRNTLENFKKSAGRGGKNAFRGQGHFRDGNGPANREDRNMKDIGTGSDGRNKRTVWTVATKPYSGAHFAVFPPDLIKPCILAGCPPGGIVFDPFFGSGTVAQVAIENGRDWLGAELNHKYIDLARKRIAQAQPALFPMDSPPMLNERV